MSRDDMMLRAYGAAHDLVEHLTVTTHEDEGAPDYDYRCWLNEIALEVWEFVNHEMNVAIARELPCPG